MSSVEWWPDARHTHTHTHTHTHRDEHYGWQLYQSDPSGNYGGWKAVAIGNGHAAAQNLLKTDYKEGVDVGEVRARARAQASKQAMRARALARPGAPASRRLGRLPPG